MVSLLTLDKEGLLSALLLGVFLVVLGGNLWWLFLILMLIFLIFSAIVTNFNKNKKKAYGIYEGTRGWKNVAANGIIPLFIVILYALRSFLGINSTAVIFAFAAAVAAITADKFSSEIGVLQRKAFTLFGMRKVNAGTSGAVSLLGFIAGFIGALIIAIFAYLLTGSSALFVITVIAGFFGDLIDSFFGYYEEQGIGSKYTTNIMCAASACLLAMLLISL